MTLWCYILAVRKSDEKPRDLGMLSNVLLQMFCPALNVGESGVLQILHTSYPTD